MGMGFDSRNNLEKKIILNLQCYEFFLYHFKRQCSVVRKSYVCNYWRGQGQGK